MIATICTVLALLLTGALIAVFASDLKRARKGKNGMFIEPIRYTVYIRNGQRYHAVASGLTEEQAEERKRELEKVYDVKVVEE